MEFFYEIVYEILYYVHAAEECHCFEGAKQLVAVETLAIDP